MAMTRDKIEARTPDVYDGIEAGDVIRTTEGSSDG